MEVATQSHITEGNVRRTNSDFFLIFYVLYILFIYIICTIFVYLYYFTYLIILKI